MKSSTKDATLCPCGEAAGIKYNIYYGDGNGHSLIFDMSRYCWPCASSLSGSMRTTMIQRIHREGYEALDKIDPDRFLREEHKAMLRRVAKD